MIATNFRRFPEALALQLCLPFGHLVQWATPRPGSRVLRAIRAARARAAAAAPFVPPWMPPLTVEPEAKQPAWLAAAKRAARTLAGALKARQMAVIDADQCALPGVNDLVQFPRFERKWRVKETGVHLYFGDERVGPYISLVATDSTKHTVMCFPDEVFVVRRAKTAR